MDDLKFFLDTFLGALATRLPEAVHAAELKFKVSAAKQAKSGPGVTLNLRFTDVKHDGARFVKREWNNRFHSRVVIRAPHEPTADQLSAAVRLAMLGTTVCYELTYHMLHAVGSKIRPTLKDWRTAVDAALEEAVRLMPVHQQEAVDFDFEVDVDAA